MDAKVGDRISLDAKKVGQARRTGDVRALIQGISGVRYEIGWDDGSVSVISPGAGVLLVEGRSAKKATPKKKTAAKRKAAPKKKVAAPKKKAVQKKSAAKSKKAASKSKPKKKSGAKRTKRR